MFILMMLLTSHSEFYQYHFTGIFFLSEIQPKICVTYDNVLTVVEFHIVACMYHTMKFQNCYHTNVCSLRCMDSPKYMEFLALLQAIKKFIDSILFTDKYTGRTFLRINYNYTVKKCLLLNLNGPILCLLNTFYSLYEVRCIQKA